VALPQPGQAGGGRYERAETGEGQCGARAECAHEQAAGTDSGEFGGVARGVVGGEGAAVESVRHPRREQCAEQNVLDTVAESAQQVAGERDGQDCPGRLDAHAGALDRERDECAGGGQV
jgi:hypothetical protein